MPLSDSFVLQMRSLPLDVFRTLGRKRGRRMATIAVNPFALLFFNVGGADGY